jgi:2,5-diamino-6-(ribosylamino)-4(3H)-pyrimidinone 5'-phosphate reductase
MTLFPPTRPDATDLPALTCIVAAHPAWCPGCPAPAPHKEASAIPYAKNQKKELAMQKENRPYVIMRTSMSVDGRIAPGPDRTMFDSHPVSALLPDESSLAKKISEAIEAEWHPGGSLYGSWTVVRKDDPLKELPPFTGSIQDLYEDFMPEDIVSETRHWVILIDGRGRYRTGYKGTETPGNHILHVVSRSVSADYLAFLRAERIPYFIGGHEHADLPDALSKMRTRLGLRAVNLLGGGTLNGVMIRQQLVDEIHLVVIPALFGGRRTPTLVDCDDLTSETTLPVLELQSAETAENGLLWLHYKVHAKPLTIDET